jgi:ABC-2 type transport system ATP-binding protein
MFYKMIKTEHISKNYGGVRALAGIDLHVERGELFGLIGPDGAGKTSLMRILTTLLLPDNGAATVNGTDVVKDYRTVRRHIGYMPGRFSLYQDLSMEENLNFFATTFGATVKENYDLIRPIYAQIEPFKKRRAGALSGGMKQKLALSCALIHRPPVLILDEPTTGVDAVSRQEFWQLLKGLKEHGITMLVSTPYMDEAVLCDRIALLQHGRILQTGTPAGVAARFPRKLYALTAEHSHRLLTQVRERPDVFSAYSFGNVLHVTFKDGVAATDIPGLTEIEPTVEDCFMALSEQPPGTAADARSPHDHICSQRTTAYAVSTRPRMWLAPDRVCGQHTTAYVVSARPRVRSTPDRDAAPVIRVRDLTKQFGRFTAVNAISFDVRKGEIFGFLGANGAGKTTAIRMLTGLLKPTSGEACVGGFDVYTQSEHLKRRIGHMSQRFSLYEDLTVAENMAFYGGIYGLRAADVRRRSNDLYDRIGLGHARHTLIRALPLGWRQKLAFMVSILHRPEIVFLDEPTGGVDPITRRQFWELIHETAGEGVTVFVTTHYMDEAEYCHRVSVMAGGVIVAMDSPGALKTQYGAGSMNEVFIKITR